MLTELCQELRNWFDLNRYEGTFTISGGTLTADFLLDGQYYRVIGSVFNDGVHKYGDSEDVLEDEIFIGQVWALGIPKAVVKLSENIAAWREKYEDVNSPAMSPYTSESFGGYSYSKSAGGSSGSQGSSSNGWQSAFANSLNRWRKL